VLHCSAPRSTVGGEGGGGGREGARRRRKDCSKQTAKGCSKQTAKVYSKQKAMNEADARRDRRRRFIVFNDAIEVLRAPAFKPGRVTQADKLGEGL